MQSNTFRTGKGILMYKYKIIVFDLDGTLVNSLTDLANAVNKGLEKVGLPIHTVEAYKYFIGNGREMLVRRAMGDACENQELFNIVHSTFDDEYKVHCNDNTSSYDGCNELLKKLNDAQLKIGVLSNKPDEFVGDILNKVYPEIKFDFAWGKKKDMPSKPDKTSLLKMLELGNLGKQDCLYIGDSNVDVFTAQNAGVDMLGVEWGFRDKAELLEAGAPEVVDSAEKIWEYINE